MIYPANFYCAKVFFLPSNTCPLTLNNSKDQETPIFLPVNSPKCSMVMDGHPLVAMHKNL